MSKIRDQPWVIYLKCLVQSYRHMRLIKNTFIWNYILTLIKQPNLTKKETCIILQYFGTILQFLRGLHFSFIPQHQINDNRKKILAKAKETKLAGYLNKESFSKQKFRELKFF